MFFARETKDFWRSDAGAITVDWTVLTASLIALGFAVTLPIATGAGRMGDSIGQALETETVEIADNAAEPSPPADPQF
jgi:hypothetical protein